MNYRETIETLDTVILGAGLAGLSAALHTRGVIYEKEGEIGGTCISQYRDGFTFDLGIHVLHTRNDYVLGLLRKCRGLDLRKKNRSAWIYSHGALTKYPFQANTFGLPQDIIEQCLAGFIDVHDKPAQKYANYEEWIYGTFGRGIAEYFYLPYSEKFWTVKARELTTDWMDVRVPRPHLKQVIAGAKAIQKEEFGPNAMFRYPQRGGVQRISSALNTGRTRILYGKTAIKIELDKKIIRFSDKSAVHYKKLISTIPLPELLRIIDTIPEAVIRSGRGLRHNSVLCLNFGIKRRDISPYHWIYFSEKKYSPFRISFPANFSRFTVPPGWSSIQAEVAHSPGRPVAGKTIVEKVLRDLVDAKVLKPNDTVKLIGTKDIKYAYVLYDHARLNNLRTITRFLKEHDTHLCGRYGKWEYLWMDEAILSGRQAAKEVRGG